MTTASLRSPIPPGWQSPITLAEVEIDQAASLGYAERPTLLLVRSNGRPVGCVAVATGQHASAAVTEFFGEAADNFVASRVRSPAPAHPAARPRSISVVVTSIRANDDLRRTLTSLLHQTVKPDKIVLVDNRPLTSGIPELVKSLTWPDRPRLQYLAEPRAGLSRARNAGLAAVCSEVVAFTDDDVIVDPGWTEALLGGFEDAAVVCVTGLILPAELETRAQVLLERFGGFSKGFTRTRFDAQLPDGPRSLYPYASGVFGSGANAAFRREALRSLGGFDERLGAGTAARGGEDLDIYISVIRSGSSIVYEPSAVLRHRHRSDYPSLRRQVFGYGVGLGAMVAKRLVDEPADRRDIARRIPTAVRYLLGPRSPKNASKGCGYPRTLTALEIAGVLVGPPAYLVSRHRASHRIPAATVPGKAEPQAAGTTWSCAVDLADGQAVPESGPIDGERAKVLVRLHSEAIGYVVVDSPGGRLDATLVVRSAQAALLPRIASHLAAEGLPLPTSFRTTEIPAATVGCPMRVTEDLFVSVVVCTRDRPEILAQNLRSLKELRYSRVHVVVVANAPSDEETRRTFDTEVGADPRFDYVVEPVPGLSRARNLGVRHCRGDVVAFTDDDVRVDPHWLHGLVHGFHRAGDVACVTGLVCPITLGPAESYFDARLSWSAGMTPRLFDLDANRLDDGVYPYSPGVFGTGANFACRRDVLLSLGGFDPALGAGTSTGGGEDLDAFVRTILAGYTLAYEPSALVWHQHRCELDALRRQMFFYGAGFTAFLTKHLTDRQTRWSVIRRLPSGIRRLSRAGQNTRDSLPETHGLPQHLLLREFLGYLAGPGCYWRERRRAKTVSP